MWCPLKHATRATAQPTADWDSAYTFSFSIVRNSFDWVVSQFFYNVAMCKPGHKISLVKPACAATTQSQTSYGPRRQHDKLRVPREP